MVRKKHLFLGVLIAMCLICVSGLCACANKDGSGNLVDFPATKTETVIYADMYTCKDEVVDTTGHAYPLTYEVTDSQGNAVKTRNGAFPIRDESYTVKYTAHVAEGNTPTSTITLTVDTRAPRVNIPQIRNGALDMVSTLPAAVYKDDKGEGSITDYKLYYLGDGETEEQREVEFTPADPDAEVKNGGTFTPTEVGNYKVVATGSNGAHSTTTEVPFVVHPAYAAVEGKLIDFTQPATEMFLQRGTTQIAMPEIVSVGSPGDEVTSLPYADKPTDNKALKISYTSAGWKSSGAVLPKDIFEDALNKFTPEQLQKATLKFKIYATSAGGMTINFYNKDFSGDLTVSADRKKCTNYKVSWNGVNQAMLQYEWLEISVGIGEHRGKYVSSAAYTTSTAYTTLLGGTATSNPAFGDCTAENFAENFGGFNFYWSAGAKGDALYVSDIYIEVESEYEAVKGKLVNFQSNGVKQYIKTEKAESITLVDSTTWKNERGTVIGAPYTEGAHVGDTQVLKVYMPKPSDHYSESFSILNAVLASGIAEYQDVELNGNATITFKMYVTSSDTEITKAYHAMRAYNSSGTASGDRMYACCESGGFVVDQWHEHSFKLSVLMNGDKFNVSTVSELVTKLNRFTFTGPVQSASGNKFAARTIFVSDIYLTPGN